MLVCISGSLCWRCWSQSSCWIELCPSQPGQLKQSRQSRVSQSGYPQSVSTSVGSQSGPGTWPCQHFILTVNRRMCSFNRLHGVLYSRNRLCLMPTPTPNITVFSVPKATLQPPMYVCPSVCLSTITCSATIIFSFRDF